MTMSKSVRIRCAGYVNPQGLVVTPGFLTLQNGKIDSLTSFSAQPDLDWPHMLLMPGFTNAHCHLELTNLGPLPPKPFTAWVEQLVQTQMAQPHYNLNTAIQKGITRLLKSGVTTIIDHFSPHTPVHAYPENPIVRIIGIAEVLGTQLQTGQRHEQSQRDKTAGNSSIRLSPHSVYGLHPEIFCKLLNKQPSHSLHVSESADEADFFSKKEGALADFIQRRGGIANNSGNSPIDTIQNLGLKLQNSLIVHGNDLSDSDLKTVKDWGNNCIVHCPGSFEYFRYKNFPIQKIISNKMRLAIGTDSIASNTDLNFLNEIQLFLKKFPEILWEEFWPMLNVNALKTLGIEYAGQITEGACADLIGFDNPKNLSPLEILKSRVQVDFAMCSGLIQILPQM